MMHVDAAASEKPADAPLLLEVQQLVPMVLRPAVTSSQRQASKRRKNSSSSRFCFSPLHFESNDSIRFESIELQQPQWRPTRGERTNNNKAHGLAYCSHRHSANHFDDDDGGGSPSVLPLSKQTNKQTKKRARAIACCRIC